MCWSFWAFESTWDMRSVDVDKDFQLQSKIQKCAILIGAARKIFIEFEKAMIETIVCLSDSARHHPTKQPTNEI